MYMDYEYKYIKYKTKYLNLMQNQSGGTNPNSIIFTQAHVKRIRYKGTKDGGDYVNTIDNDILNENSEFRIGSISKLFMDITILLMQEKNELSVNDKLSKYIGSENQKNIFSKITLLDIMNHKSGMKRSSDDRKNDKIPQDQIVPKYKNATEVMKLFIDESLFEHKKGDESYSNIGFIILGAVIEKITGINNYSKIIKKYLLNPLGMKHTDIGETNIKLYNENGKPLSENAFNEIYYAASSGGFYSTVHDMIMFAEHFPRLFKDPQIIELLDICHVNDMGIMIQHGGLIQGGASMFSAEYTQKFEFVDCRIEFDTVVE